MICLQENFTYIHSSLSALRSLPSMTSSGECLFTSTLSEVCYWYPYLCHVCLKVWKHVTERKGNFLHNWRQERNLPYFSKSLHSLPDGALQFPLRCRVTTSFILKIVILPAISIYLRCLLLLGGKVEIFWVVSFLRFLNYLYWKAYLYSKNYVEHCLLRAREGEMSLTRDQTDKW